MEPNGSQQGTTRNEAMTNKATNGTETIVLATHRGNEQHSIPMNCWHKLRKPRGKGGEGGRRRPQLHDSGGQAPFSSCCVRVSVLRRRCCSYPMRMRCWPALGGEGVGWMPSLGLRGGVHMETPIDSTLALFLSRSAPFSISMHLCCAKQPPASSAKRRSRKNESILLHMFPCRFFIWHTHLQQSHP